MDAALERARRRLDRLGLHPRRVEARRLRGYASNPYEEEARRAVEETRETSRLH